MDTIFLYLSFLGCIVSFLIAQEAVLDFDCRRQGAECYDSRPCDVTTGRCDCRQDGGNSTDTGYKCGDNRASGTCPSPCVNGVCVNSTCVCQESYYGETCHMNRVQVDCDDTSMFLNVHPDVTSFYGNISVLGHNNEDGCVFQLGQGGPGIGEFVVNRDDLEGYRLRLAHSGSDCGEVLPENRTLENGDSYTSYTRKFLVRHSADFVTSFDQIITAECHVGENDAMTITSSATIVNQSDKEFTNVTVDTEVKTNVVLTVQNGDGSPLSDPVALGADIRLLFTLKTGSVFKDFHIVSCVANNTDPDNSTVKEIEFIADRCPKAGTWSLFRRGPVKIPTQDPGVEKSLVVDMKVFKFIGDFDQVAFVCDIVLCADNQTAKCQDPGCPGSFISDGPSGRDTPPVGGGQPINGSNPLPEVIPEVDDYNFTAENSSATGNSSAPGNSSMADNSSLSETNSTSGNSSTLDLVNDIGVDSDNVTLTSLSNTSGVNTTGTAWSGLASMRRRRRRRRRSSGDHQKVVSVMTVYDPYDVTHRDMSSRKINPSMKECMLHPEIVVVLVILANGVFWLTIITIVMALQLTRSKKEVDPEPSHSVEQVETIKLPRLVLDKTTQRVGRC